MILVEVREAVIEEHWRRHGGWNVEVDMALRHILNRYSPGICIIDLAPRPFGLRVWVDDVVEVPGCGFRGHWAGCVAEGCLRGAVGVVEDEFLDLWERVLAEERRWERKG